MALTSQMSPVVQCDPLLDAFYRQELTPPYDAVARGYFDRCARPEKRIRAVALRTKKKVVAKEKPPEPPEPPLPKEAQVVEIPKVDPPEVVKPVETKYVAKENTRTKKETRSRRPKRSTRKAPGKVSVEKPSPVQSKRSKSAKPTVTTKKKEELKVSKSPQKLPDAAVGQRPSESVMKHGAESRILLPSGSKETAMANLQALSGDFTTTDHLPELDRASSTLLNANRYRFADFFLRVKRAVEKQWKPGQVYRRRDPTGKAFGVKDRYTLLKVTLDKRGKVRSLKTTRNSGLAFMDKEAKQSFQRAQPFRNPPKGLLNNNNEVVFEFGFYFEITNGKHRFRWRRL